jgi:hypothetical protein
MTRYILRVIRGVDTVEILATLFQARSEAVAVGEWHMRRGVRVELVEFDARALPGVELIPEAQQAELLRPAAACTQPQAGGCPTCD